MKQRKAFKSTFLKIQNTPDFKLAVDDRSMEQKNLCTAGGAAQR